jgi:hypothetical protein
MPAAPLTSPTSIAMRKRLWRPAAAAAALPAPTQNGEVKNSKPGQPPRFRFKPPFPQTPAKQKHIMAAAGSQAMEMSQTLDGTGSASRFFFFFLPLGESGIQMLPSPKKLVHFSSLTRLSPSSPRLFVHVGPSSSARDLEARECGCRQANTRHPRFAVRTGGQSRGAGRGGARTAARGGRGHERPRKSSLRL